MSFVALECNVARSRNGAARDQVEQGRLSGAVRPDDGADLVFLYVDIQIIDGLEAVERYAHPLDCEQMRPHGVACELARDGRDSGLAHL